MKTMSPEEYASNSGNKCPVCKSGNVETSGPLEADDNYARQQCWCAVCDSQWTDSYTLVGYQNLEEGGDDNNPL